MRFKFIAALVTVTFAGLVSLDARAEIPWSNPSGSTSDFAWSNGRTDNNLFGSPTVVGNSFVFFPSNFRAESSNGVAGQISDRLAFTLQMKPGVDLLGVTMQEAGDYSILGNGAVNAQGGLFVKNLDGAGLVSATMVSTPSMPHSSATGAAGLWQGTANAVITQNWDTVEVVFNNILQATTVGSGSAAAIEKKVAEAIIISFIIPEPASAGLLLLAGGALLMRRRA